MRSCAGRARNAFCVVRPPGHHANAGRGMGFCLFNNVAIAARYAQRKHGVGRVLIVDWDVHHGNGTQDIFYADPSVFFFSTHQWPLYPGTGRADETGAGGGRRDHDELSVSGGIRARGDPGRGAEVADARHGGVPARAGADLGRLRFADRRPLGRFTLTDEDFADLTRAVMEIADRSAGGRVVSMLEGGIQL